MTTLVERTRDLSNQIRSLAGSQATNVESQGLGTRAKELTELANLVSVPATRIQAFVAHGVRIEGSALLARSLKTSIDTILAEFSEDSTNILEANPQWRLVTKNKFSDLAASTTDLLQEAWRSFVLTQKPDIDHGRRLTWNALPAHQKQAAFIETQLIEFDRLAEILPTSDEDFDLPKSIAADIANAIRDLPNEPPEPVLVLFQAIDDGTATAAFLTVEATAWLRENGLLESIGLGWKVS